MSLSSAIKTVEVALDQAPKCAAGLMARNRVIGIEKGPSGGKEILASLFLDDPVFGFWYGHILPHPKNENTYVALLVWSSQFINATNVPLFFRRFHYWIKDRLEYHPCTIQGSDDAYAEASSLDTAALALARMICNFDIDQRTGFEGSDFERDPSELRITDIYGMEDNRDENGCFPPVPMLTELKIVGQAG